MTEAVDPQKFRVSLFCVCQDDMAYGFGPTTETARRVAEGIFREHHGARTQYRQIIVEEAVAHGGGGSHYELFAAGLRYDFTRGLGAEVCRHDKLLDKRDHPTHPYLFEAYVAKRAQQLRDVLWSIANDAGKNAKMRAAAQRAFDEITRLARVVWGSWTGLCPAGKHGLDYEGQPCDLCSES